MVRSWELMGWVRWVDWAVPLGGGEVAVEPTGSVGRGLVSLEWVVKKWRSKNPNAFKKQVVFP